MSHLSVKVPRLVDPGVQYGDMKFGQAVTLMKDLCASSDSFKLGPDGAFYDDDETLTWVTRASVAVHAIFPIKHPVRLQWDALAVPGHYFGATGAFNRARTLLKVALASAEAGELASVIDGVRADTVGEVLDQAEALLAGTYAVAATVLAGGALETHLLHLCTRNGLALSGAGSISKYDGAIAQARNQGNVIYSAGDTKLVVAWGDQRNEAAHDPTNYKRTEPEVRLMIDGIRQFTARNP